MSQSDSLFRVQARYSFKLEKGGTKEFEVDADVRHTGSASRASAPWTKLSFQKCAHCPLKSEVFRVAGAAGRTLVTLDLDFANPLRFPVRATPGVVVVRAPRPVLSLLVETIRRALPQLAAGQVEGKLWIVEPGRIRRSTQTKPLLIDFCRRKAPE